MRKPNLTKEWVTGFTSNVTGVIIGIALTFGITFLVQHCQERKQTEHLLSMVVDELEKNLEELESQKEYLVDEYTDARALRPYIDTPEKIPIDRLEHITVLVRLAYYEFRANSLEVLKNSSQIQIFSNKDLLREIFNIYGLVESHSTTINTLYLSRKERGWIYYYEQMDDRFITKQSINADEAMALFRGMMKDNINIRNYIVWLAQGQDESRIEEMDELRVQIEKVIAMIEEEIE